MMTIKTKQKLITQIIALLNIMIAVEDEKPQITMSKSTEPRAAFCFGHT